MKKKIPKDSIAAYRATYMAERNFKGRSRHLCVSEEVAKKVGIIVRYAGENTTIGSFVDNILREHLKNHADTINAMFANLPEININNQ